MSESLAHLSKLDELVRLEYEYEQKAFNESVLRKCIFGHLSDSDCVFPVQLVASSRSALDQLIVGVRFDTSEEDAGIDFEPGKPVAFFHMASDGQTVKMIPHNGMVDHVTQGTVYVQLAGPAVLQSLQEMASNSLLGLRIGVDNTSYAVMHEALQKAMRRTDERFVQLRETLIGPLQPRFRSMPAVRCPWLNEGQNVAVQRVLESQDVAVVHGPPGTGKTTTLIESIVETLQRETQVLVCAPSNAAVDWISSQLYRRGISVLRIGNPLRMSDDMLECSYERRYAAHPDYAELWNVRRTLRQLRRETHHSDAHRTRIHNLSKRQTELELRIHSDLFEQSRVVAATLIGSAYHILEGRHFHTLFIDEAAQALEPACWAALLKCDRVVFSGDHQQLSPTVRSGEAARQGLSKTLMQRVVSKKPNCVSLLTIQYRMHRDIMHFSSKWFYDGQLQAAPEVADRFISPVDTPLLWVDTSAAGFDERQSRTLSHSNSAEARLLLHVLREYVDLIGESRLQADRVDFGIITPYRSQVRLLRRLLKMQHFFRHLRHQISVGTVDGFQGQERDVVVISMVRDNDDGRIGFLRDLRRMNVAMTRARMKLIVVGNATTLGHHPFYKQLIEYFQSQGAFVRHIPSERAE